MIDCNQMGSTEKWMLNADFNFLGQNNGKTLEANSSHSMGNF